MKQLTTFINESTDVTNEMLKYIVSVDFRIPEMKLNEMDRQESLRTNEKREAIIAKLFDDIFKKDTRFSEYHVMTLREYMGRVWSTKNDIEDGDIVVVDTDKNAILYIDIKVDNSKKYYGTINMNSIMNFKKDDKHVYVCMSNDGRIVRCFKAMDVRNTLADNRELKMSKHRKNIAKDCSGKFKMSKGSTEGWTTTDESTYNVYEDDFMGCVQLNRVPTITKRG